MKFGHKPDQESEISNWENDGGASFPTSKDELKREEDCVLLYRDGASFPIGNVFQEIFNGSSLRIQTRMWRFPMPPS